MPVQYSLVSVGCPEVDRTSTITSASTVRAVSIAVEASTLNAETVSLQQVVVFIHRVRSVQLFEVSDVAVEFSDMVIQRVDEFSKLRHLSLRDIRVSRDLLKRIRQVGYLTEDDSPELWEWCLYVPQFVDAYERVLGS
jgi:hypothetical protein